MRIPLSVVPLCSVEGCGRPCHGRGQLCATHKARKLMGAPLDAPIRGYDHDPRRRVERALGEWYEALVRKRDALDEQRAKLDALLLGEEPIDAVRRAQAMLAEVDACDDREWRRAQCALWQALNRYVEAHQKTPKHKFQARRRQ